MLPDLSKKDWKIICAGRYLNEGFDPKQLTRQGLQYICNLHNAPCDQTLKSTLVEHFKINIAWPNRPIPWRVLCQDFVYRTLLIASLSGTTYVETIVVATYSLILRIKFTKFPGTNWWSPVGFLGMCCRFLQKTLTDPFITFFSMIIGVMCEDC